jgi:hypothetical protein
MVYAWENIKEVTYRSEIIDGVEVIYPMSSNKGTVKTVDFETAMSTNFGFRNGNGEFYEIKDLSDDLISTTRKALDLLVRQCYNFYSKLL